MRIKVIIPEIMLVAPYTAVSADVINLAIEKKMMDENGIPVYLRKKGDKVSDTLKDAGKVVDVEQRKEGGLIVTIDITHAGVVDELTKTVPEKIGISVWDNKSEMRMFPPKLGGECPVRIQRRKEDGNKGRKEST